MRADGTESPAYQSLARLKRFASAGEALNSENLISRGRRCRGGSLSSGAYRIERIDSDRGRFAQGVTFSKGGLLIGDLCLMGVAL